MTTVHISFPWDTMAQGKSEDHDTTLQSWRRYKRYQWLGFIFFQPEEIQIQNTK